MMKSALVFVALAIVVNAHWTHDESLAVEIGAPPGETMPEGHVENNLETVDMVQESAGADAITYRITIGTAKATREQAATSPPWSTHVFHIDLTGMTGQKTGKKDMRYYAPSLSYSAASGAAGSMAPQLHPGMRPTNCEPNTGGCTKHLESGDDVKWVGERGGMIQHAQIESSEKIGEIKSVKIGEKTDGLKQEEYNGWTPSFIKINANNFKTGLGAGVYYINPAGKEIRGNNNLLSATIPDSNGKIASGKVELKKCLAQFCEEEMDDKLGL